MLSGFGSVSTSVKIDNDGSDTSQRYDDDRHNNGCDGRRGGAKM